MERDPSIDEKRQKAGASYLLSHILLGYTPIYRQPPALSHIAVPSKVLLTDLKKRNSAKSTNELQ